ncbi:hypothetical protein pqer_cds_1124 [Pandoravirus quercus]|uniref:Uncharacterized protein n=2 Tax=Pandoravirus TaxID=2060084 RepID=A0A2U7UAU3_9VIRU|nr:hypothetical protein pqer_cds_1124 [Pandoravirus quercus]AVK75546.1 hypothetical protein pqer_cds_1124 [Pandoravirus quercus]QBZ81721.1 hypothetical protein pclt_cds_1139 [Pandoravirus celtis]
MLTKIGLLVLAFVLVVPAIFAYRAHVESAPTTIEQFKKTCFDSVWKVVLLFLVFLGLEQGVRMAVRQDILCGGASKAWGHRAFRRDKRIEPPRKSSQTIDCLCGQNRQQTVIDGVAYAFDHPDEPYEEFYFHVVKCAMCDSIDFALQQNNSDADTTDSNGNTVPFMSSQRGLWNGSTAEPAGQVREGKSSESLPLLVPSQRERCPKSRHEERHQVLVSVKMYGWTGVCGVPFPTKSKFKILCCSACGDLHGKKERRERF